ncbi:serine/threonine protein kinase [Galactobacter valiniphilus]|uniref:serine/threonine protein kinase n=1 Tax=Galactobacter valiniphilus TaxID=2676122 RepID=UPI0037370BD8
MEHSPDTRISSTHRQGRHCADSPGITGPARPRGAAAAPRGAPPDPAASDATAATLTQPAARASAAASPADAGSRRVLVGVGGQARVWRQEGPEGAGEGHDDGGGRLVREGRLTLPEAWDHPHLVALFGPTADDAGVVMELVPGGTLEGLMEARGTLPVGEAVTLLVPLARALAHLHAAGVSHGDVAPQNIMFRADSSPVLIDPGSIRLPAQAPGPASTLGFAPEGEAPGTAGDVYAWGAVAWWVLTGEQPGPASHRTPLIMLCRELSPATARLIEDCVDADPRVRPPASELAGELLAGERPRPLDASAAVTAAGSPHMLTQAPPPTGWRAALAALAARRASVAARLSRGSRRRRAGVSTRRAPSRWFYAPALGLLLAAGAVLAWRASPAPPQAPAASLSQVSAAERNAAAVGALPALDRARTAALRDRDETALAAVYAPQSPALSADRATIAALLEAGQRFEGMGSRLEAVQAVGADNGGDVVVRAVAVQASYRVTGPGNAPSTLVPASSTPLRWTLRHGEEGWRILSVHRE